MKKEYFEKLERIYHFPARWKEANVTPILNEDDRSLPSNYRPSSLLI